MSDLKILGVYTFKDVANLLLRFWDHSDAKNIIDAASWFMDLDKKELTRDNLIEEGFRLNMLSTTRFDSTQLNGIRYVGDLLNHVMTWSETPQGGNFWQRVYDITTVKEKAKLRH